MSRSTRLDLSGRIFNKLTVIKEGPRSKQNVKRWECLCSCGNTTLVPTFNLIHGTSKSCGCWGREQTLINQKFGKLTVVKKSLKKANKRIMWLCKCDCGNDVEVKGAHLKSGNTSSCGCLKNELFKEMIHRKHKKGPVNKVKNLYKSYMKGAKARGYNFNLTLAEFIDLISKPCHYCGSFFKEYNGIDRKDNTKGYSIKNCVPCCSTCNNAKKTLPYEDFINWGLKLSANLKIKFPYTKIN